MRQSFAVLALAGLILVAFVTLGQYAPGQNMAGFERFGVEPALMLSGEEPLSATLSRLFGHVFFHYGILHLLMNALAYMQAAPFVALKLGADWRFLILFFVSALGGAAAFMLINPASEVGAVGASGAICGLFGAYFLSVRPTPRAALADPQIRSAILSFLGINVVLMALLPLPIAWEAHLGGFIAGAIAYPLLAPKRRFVGPWG
jgi:membrane associated rhomboid family serine protease